MNKNKIAIISSKKFAGKIYEDILLQKYLTEKNISTDICAWEDNTTNWNIYKAMIIRSAWGYHKNFNKFETFLNEVKRRNILLINSVETLLWNIYKNKQLTDLALNGVRTVPTHFIEGNISNLDGILKELSIKFKTNDFVIKPNISASGDNTHYICLNNNKIKLKNKLTITEAQEKYQELLNKKTIKGVLIQPFIKNIVNGEYSFVFINSALTHAMLRFPSVLYDRKDIIEVEISSIPKKLLKFAKNCSCIVNNIAAESRKTVTYARYDIVENDGAYLLMEAELTEPDLLIRNISSLEKQHCIVKKLANAIVKRINENE